MATNKNILEELPLKKREALGRIFDSPDYVVFKEAIRLLQDNIASWALIAQDFPEVRFLAGQAHGLKMLHQNLKNLHKITNEEIDKVKKKSES